MHLLRRIILTVIVLIETGYSPAFRSLAAYLTNRQARILEPFAGFRSPSRLCWTRRLLSWRTARDLEVLQTAESLYRMQHHPGGKVYCPCAQSETRSTDPAERCGQRFPYSGYPSRQRCIRQYRDDTATPCISVSGSQSTGYPASVLYASVRFGTDRANDLLLFFGKEDPVHRSYIESFRMGGR